MEHPPQSHEIAAEAPDLMSHYGNTEYEIMGIRAPLHDLRKLCPIPSDDSRMNAAAENAFIVKVINESGGEILPEHESLFRTTLQSQDIEVKVRVVADILAQKDDQPVETRVVDEAKPVIIDSLATKSHPNSLDELTVLVRENIVPQVVGEVIAEPRYVAAAQNLSVEARTHHFEAAEQYLRTVMLDIPAVQPPERVVQPPAEEIKTVAPKATTIEITDTNPAEDAPVIDDANELVQDLADESVGSHETSVIYLEADTDSPEVVIQITETHELEHAETLPVQESELASKPEDILQVPIISEASNELEEVSLFFVDGAIAIEELQQVEPDQEAAQSFKQIFQQYIEAIKYEESAIEQEVQAIFVHVNELAEQLSQLDRHESSVVSEELEAQIEVAVARMLECLGQNADEQSVKIFVRYLLDNNWYMQPIVLQEVVEDPMHERKFTPHNFSQMVDAMKPPAHLLAARYAIAAV